VRAVMLLVIARRRKVIDRPHRYRPLIDRVEMWLFAGMSAPWWKLRAIRSILLWVSCATGLKSQAGTLGEPSGAVARRALATMVEVPDEG
jgi:hypothetical protein